MIFFKKVLLDDRARVVDVQDQDVHYRAKVHLVPNDDWISKKVPAFRAFVGNMRQAMRRAWTDDLSHDRLLPESIGGALVQFEDRRIAQLLWSR
jgi:uncharacterized protein (DUF736 family)